MIYFLVFLFIFILSQRYSFPIGEGRIYYWLLYGILVFLAAFRYKVGNDTFYYTQEYANFPTLFQLNGRFIEESNYQILWILFESSIRTISSSFYLLQFVLASFVNFVVFKTVLKYSKHPFLAILFYYLIFYVHLNMEILRESIPICLLLLGIGFIQNRQYYRYYLLSVLGIFFHESAIVLLFVPLIALKSYSRRTYAIFILLFYFSAELITGLFIEVLPHLNIISQAKLAYFDYSLSSQKTGIFDLSKYIILPSTILLGFHRHLNPIERNFILFYILASVLFFHFNIFYRVRDYFLIMLFIALTNGLMQRFGRKTNTIKDLIRPGIVSIFLFLFLFRFYYQDLPDIKYQSYLNYYPYSSIFNETVPPERLQNIRSIYNSMQDFNN